MTWTKVCMASANTWSLICFNGFSLLKYMDSFHPLSNYLSFLSRKWALLSSKECPLSVSPTLRSYRSPCGSWCWGLKRRRPSCGSTTQSQCACRGRAWLPTGAGKEPPWWRWCTPACKSENSNSPGSTRGSDHTRSRISPAKREEERFLAMNELKCTKRLHFGEMFSVNWVSNKNLWGCTESEQQSLTYSGDLSNVKHFQVWDQGSQIIQLTVSVTSPSEEISLSEGSPGPSGTPRYKPL